MVNEGLFLAVFLLGRYIDDINMEWVNYVLCLGSCSILGNLNCLEKWYLLVMGV